MRAAQSLAALRGRNFVLPDDIKELFTPVLAHRLVIDSKERLKGITDQNILQEILEETEIPTVELSK
jgi:MoxR-like ATPase